MPLTTILLGAVIGASTTQIILNWQHEEGNLTINFTLGLCAALAFSAWVLI